MKERKGERAERVGKVGVLAVKAKLEAMVHHAFGKHLLQRGNKHVGHARNVRDGQQRVRGLADKGEQQHKQKGKPAAECERAQ